MRRRHAWTTDPGQLKESNLGGTVELILCKRHHPSTIWSGRRIALYIPSSFFSLLASIPTIRIFGSLSRRKNPPGVAT